MPDIATIESADAVLILGEDVTNTAPRIASCAAPERAQQGLRAGCGTEAGDLAGRRHSQPAQHQRSPLFIAAVADTPLDDVATQCLTWPRPALPRWGRRWLPAWVVAIAKPPQITQPVHCPGHTGRGRRHHSGDLAGAKRPLVIAGTTLR